MVNNSLCDHLELPSGSKYLELNIVGSVLQPLKFELEIRLHDMYGNPLAFFSPGHEKGIVPLHAKGNYSISHCIELPRIMRGEYLLSLYLTTPNVHCWVSMPNALKIIAEGTTTATGQVFDYYQQRIGWILLSEGSNNENDR